MRRLLLLLVMVMPLQLVPQEVHYAPTVEQCRVDQQLLMSKLKPSKGMRTSNVSYKELDSWTKEILECLKVDPENEVRYYKAVREINLIQIDRLETFLSRHSLYDQFIAEDTQGCHGIAPCKALGRPPGVAD